MRVSTLTLCAAISAVAAPAQIRFDPVFGAPQGAGDDTISAGLALGFPFSFPDGTVVTAIDVDSNGRLLAPGGGTSAPFPFVPDMLSGASSICPFWTDLDFGDPAAGDVHFKTDGTVATVTFADAVLKLGSEPFSVQVQLWADGRIGFAYDARVPPDFPVVGLAQGGGAADPGPVDFSTATPGPLATGGTATVYEDFLFGGFFDLIGESLEFVPDGASGWNVTGGSLPFAEVSRYGKSCTTGLRWTPDGAGGYTVTRCGAACFDPSFGASLGMTGDDEVGGPHALGFSFTMPGGTTVTALDVSSNGRLIEPGGDQPDYSPSAAELLGDPAAVLAPLWTDLDVSMGGDVLLRTGPGFATFTWSGIAQFGGTEPLTFQATVHGDGSITFAYFDTTDWDEVAGFNGFASALVGISPGFGAADPGETDFNVLPIARGNSGYEFWDASAGERFDLQLTTTPLSAPGLGGTWEIRVEGITSTTLAANLILGFQRLGLDLGLVPLGLDGCFLLTTPAVGGIPLSFAGSESQVYGLPITNTVGLTGLRVFVQAVNIAPGETPLGAVLGNGVEGVIGL